MNKTIQIPGKLRKFITRKTAAAAAAAVVIFLIIGPALMDGMINPVMKDQWRKPSERALRLHAGIAGADLHADSLMGGRNLLERSSRGHVDVPRLIEGRTALQVFDVVTCGSFSSNLKRNAPPPVDAITMLAVAARWPVSTWSSKRERVLYQAARLREMAAGSGGKLSVILSRADMEKFLARRKSNPNITAALLGVEGAHALEGKISTIDEFHRAGVRMMSPTHFFDNDTAGSMQGESKYGLTPNGRNMVRRMEQLRMIVDAAHLSERGIDDLLKMSTRPIVVSHTGVIGTCDVNRNINDRQLREIAKRGGLVGIMYWETALCGRGPDAIARAIRHAANVAGADHVALGSDYDGSITAPFDTSKIVYITDALIRQGFTDEEIEKIMGGNVLEFLSKNLP